MRRIRERRDFRAAARGRRVRERAFVLQWRCRGDADPPRFGFTVTRKTAARAVERNRIRRRLRESVRKIDPAMVKPGTDFVIVARRQALVEPFASLISGLNRSLAAIKSGRSAGVARPEEAADG